jgi:hypothetical protein
VRTVVDFSVKAVMSKMKLRCPVEKHDMDSVLGVLKNMEHHVSVEARFQQDES